MLLAILPALAILAVAEVAPPNADCKEGARLYQEPVSNIVGCYKLFPWNANWRSARSFCNDCSFGFCGTLAAARTQGEHDFLKGLAGYGVRFWLAANSLSNDKIWRWDGYSLGVNFNQPWVSTADLNYQAHTDQVILAGRIAPYEWDFALSNTSTGYFICRKDACAPNMDVLDGLCSQDAPSVRAKSSSSIAWIAAPIVVGTLIILTILTLVFLYHFHNDKYNVVMQRLRSCGRRGANSNSSQPSTSQRVAELKEENNRLRAQLRASLGDADSIAMRMSGDPSPRNSRSSLSQPLPPLIPAALSPALPTVASLPRIRKGPMPGTLPSLPDAPPPLFEASPHGGGAAPLAQAPTVPPIVPSAVDNPVAGRPASLRGLGLNRVGPSGPAPVVLSLPRPSLTIAPPSPSFDSNA